MEKYTDREPKRRPRPKRKVHREETVYTEAKPVNISRFFVRIATVLAVVFAIVFGMSIFFKVETITVSGMENYSAWVLAEASGIEKGDNLLTLS